MKLQASGVSLFTSLQVRLVHAPSSLSSIRHKIDREETFVAYVYSLGIVSRLFIYCFAFLEKYPDGSSRRSFS
jgi:hypothetical protein